MKSPAKIEAQRTKEGGKVFTMAVNHRTPGGFFILEGSRIKECNDGFYSIFPPEREVRLFMRLGGKYMESIEDKLTEL